MEICSLAGVLPAGTAGAQGIPGPAGTQGPVGLTGSQGVPVVDRSPPDNSPAATLSMSNVSVGRKGESWKFIHQAT
jgi:hypothetical protein